MNKAITLLLILAAFTMACSRPRPSATSTAIANAVETDSEIIDIGTLSTEEWDRLHVFAPYSSSENITKELGFEWQDYEKSGIFLNEGVSLLLFLKGDTIVEWFAHPRRQGDFALAARFGGYTRSEAVFTLERTGAERWPTIKYRE